MLDYFGIFTRGGALLFTLQFTALRQNPVDALNALISTCLLEERSGENTFTFTPKTGAQQALKWTFHNGLGLVFVAVYQKSLSLLYVDELLQKVRNAFVEEYKPAVYAYPQFDDTFRKLLNECESKADEARRPMQTRQAQAHAKTNRGRSSTTPQGDENDGEDEDGVAGASEDSGIDSTPEAQLSMKSDEEADGSTAFDVSKLSKGGRGRGRGKAPGRGAGREEKPKKESAPAKKGLRSWREGREKEEKLDFSTDVDERNAGGVAQSDALDAVRSLMDAEEDSLIEEEVEVTMDDVKSSGPESAKKPRGLLSSFVNNLAMRVVGSSSLSAEDLLPALDDMKKKLMERNVAEEIASQICTSVCRSLEGQKLSSFTGVTAFVKRAFEDSLNSILNKRSVDMLQEIKKSKARGQPYVVVFCGVNGVGKSTNLAKICYWLGQHNMSVIIAACDTFRAGAVEQLKTHCARLKVSLYERGYEKDPAKVASEAIKQAERDRIDVVLVDTAGRMQDNEPLMRALSSLINMNSPDLVLFVGEALVGNDAVDQLTKFNRALQDLAPPGMRTRQMINGIVLTKFDTIDDKVGAALSMTYTSGAPIMFVGCGQTYVDLKKLNVKSVVNSLLK